MRCDMKKLFQQGSLPVGGDFSLTLSARDFPGYCVVGPVTGTWGAQLHYDRVVLTLSVKAVASGVCARCLSPTQTPVKFDREWQFRRHELDDPDFELPLDDNGCIDVDELIYQEIVIEVPPVLLCSPDCLGLCPICGKKKEAGCTCQQAEDAAPVDARLAILKKLLN